MRNIKHARVGDWVRIDVSASNEKFSKYLYVNKKDVKSDGRIILEGKSYECYYNKAGYSKFNENDTEVYHMTRSYPNTCIVEPEAVYTTMIQNAEVIATNFAFESRIENFKKQIGNYIRYKTFDDFWEIEVIALIKDVKCDKNDYFINLTFDKTYKFSPEKYEFLNSWNDSIYKGELNKIKYEFLPTNFAHEKIMEEIESFMK